LDLAGAGKHSVELIGYLHLIPCPVIGVGRGGDALANACDLLVPDIDNLRPLAARIADAPVTAMALVQLLRATEGMDTGNALAMESLAYATLQAGAEFSHWLHGRATENAEEKAADAGAEVLLCRERGELSIALNRP